MNRNLWGPLADRYDNDKPRKILALDGGGIRGVIALGVLAEMEKQLSEISGRGAGFRLCEYFDYIGGTSTGAIIAAGLARGKSVKELLNLYVKKGKDMFDKKFFLKFARLGRYKYPSENLAEQLKEILGKETRLHPHDLECLVMLMTMNVDTDSPWPISSNPEAKYNDTSRPDCNLDIPLWQLVRASTAAPAFFNHEILQWDPEDPDKRFAFIDGGMTPHNNPAWLMYRMATLPEYKLNWPTGEDKLLIVSVGTGSVPNYSRYDNILDIAKELPLNLLNTMKVEKDISCRQIGRCTYGGIIDRELGDMIPKDEEGNPIPLDHDQGRQFLYARYDVEITDASLEAMGLSHIDPSDLEQMDAVEHIDDFKSIGQELAKEVKVKEHFGDFAREGNF